MKQANSEKRSLDRMRRQKAILQRSRAIPLSEISSRRPALRPPPIGSIRARVLKRSAPSWIGFSSRKHLPLKESL